MTPLEILSKYFFAGTAEQEREQLSELFIRNDELRTSLRSVSQRFHLIVGLKGVGKSALLLDEQLESQRVGISFYLKPDDLEVKFSADSSVGHLKRIFYKSLLSTVAAELGERLGGQLTDRTEIILRSEALKTGAASTDIIERLSAVLSAFLVKKGSVEIDFSKVKGADDPVRTINSLYRAVKDNSAKKTLPIFIYFDDTDQLAGSDFQSDYLKIWAFILAIRELTIKIPKIHATVSLRSNIWNRMRVVHSSRLDQVDHIDPHVIELDADEEKLKKIFLRRIEVAAKELDSPNRRPEDNPLDLFFATRDTHLPEQTEERRPWEIFAAKNARNRPRDMIQLISKLIELSKAKGKIEEGFVNKAAATYSEERVEYLKAEFGEEFSPIKEILRSLSAGKDEMSFEETRRLLENIPSSFTTSIRGFSLRPQTKEAVVALLGALFEMGVINGRITDVSKPKEFSHVTFQKDPGLVSIENWNGLQKYRWEIHPAFRSFLHSIQRQNDNMRRKR